MRWPKRKKERKEIERLIRLFGDYSNMAMWERLVSSNLSWDQIIPSMFGWLEGWRIKDEG